MQHNPLATGKPDPPGPEHLLMTSVCQPRDGRNAEKGRNEVGGEWWGKEEMERVEGRGFLLWGRWGGAAPQGYMKAKHLQRCQFPFLFTKRKGNWPQAGVTDFIFIGNKLYSSSCSFWIYNSHPGSLFFLTKETNEKWHKWNDGACMSCFAAYFCLECSRALLLSPYVCLRCSCRDDTPYSSFPSEIWGSGPFLLTTLEPYPFLCSIH